MWKTLDEKPAGIFDVLARYYDADMDAFLIQRFCGCFEQEGRYLWCSPFIGDGSSVDLAKHGYKVVRWMELPDAPAELLNVLAAPPSP